MKPDWKFVFVWLLAAALAGSFVTAQNTLLVGVDSDNDPSTGCDIFVQDANNAGQTVSGHEFFISVDVIGGASPAIDRLVINQCTGASFAQLSVDNSPQCTFSANSGISGADVVDCLLPLQLPGPFVRVIFYSQSQSGSRDVVNQDGQDDAQEAVVALQGLQQIPTLSQWGWLLLAAALIAAALLLLKRHPSGLAMLLLALCLPAAGPVQAFVDGAVKAMFTDLVGDSTGGDPASDIAKAGISADSNGIWAAIDVVDLENSPPQLDLDADNSGGISPDFAATFTEGAGPVGIADSDVSISDLDGTTLSSASVTITNPQDGASELLAASACAGLTVAPGLNTLSISGVQPHAVYEACLASVTYDNTAAGPSLNPSRIVDFVINDGNGGSDTATSTVTLVMPTQGVINIIKDTVPDGPQDFAFTSTGGLIPPNFSLDDDADGTLSNTQSFTTAFGTYTVSETAVPGFDLTIACVDPDGQTTTAGDTATIDLDATETVTCTFTNTQRGTINIVKDTVPDGPQDFDYSSDIPGGPANFSLDDDADGTLSNTQTFSNIVPGSYSVTEAAVAGFDLTALVCVDSDGGGTASSGNPGTAVATINLDAGETVTCTYTNTQQGTISIVKDTVPDGPQDFDYSSNIPGGPANFSLDDDADGTLPNTQNFSNVAPGSYTVSETAVAGFDLTIACLDPDGGTSTAGATATIDLDAGESVTCTFTNTQRGIINIVKDTVPDDPQDFDYTTDIPGGPANFSLDDDADGTLSNTQMFSNVVPGSYTVTEAAVAGFDLTIACVDPDGGTTTAMATATIDLDAGETVTCTFTNTQRGTINIVKDTVPDGPQDFDYTTDIPGGPANFSLDDDADGTLSNTQMFSNVVPGSYTVTEMAVAGFSLSIACVDPDGGTSTAMATATIDLDAGETVTCTFTNTQQGTINIVKDTVPDGPQDFDFTTDIPGGPANFSLDDDADGTLSNTETFSNVVPGSYTVTEMAVAGFDLSIACVDPDGGTSTAMATATIDLDAGETVTCTFTNTQQGTINIVKDTVPDDPQDFDYTTDIPGGPANFSLDDDADGMLSNTQTFNVAPGSYTVTESAPLATFFLSDLSCVDPDGGTMTAGATATIDLDAGETVTCTFTNTATAPPSAVADPNGGLAANSTPSNDAMVAGTDDAYHTALNTMLSVPDGAGDLLDNDSLGTPTATMTSFGPNADPTMFAPGSGTQANATDANGSLDVNANGSFTYTPPSATFTGLDSFAYRLTNSAGTSDGTVTLAVGLRPGAVADIVTLGATGNVAMQSDRAGVQLNGMTGQTLISNDVGDQISLTAIEMTSANLGNVSSPALNHFRYNPFPGFTGADSFMYTIANGFGSSMATVSLTVNDMIWFIDAGATCPCDGRLTNPFDDLAATGNSFDANANDDPGDNIFLDAGSYTGGLTLLDNQRLIGDGSSGTLVGLTLITLAAGSDALPVFGGTNPTITSTNADAITLGSGNTIRGLTIGNTGTGTGIFGNFGSLFVRETTINGTGQALDLTNGTLDVIFDSVSSTSGSNGIDLDTVSGSFDANAGALSGSTGSAFLVNNSTANIDYDGTITNTAGRSVDVQGSSGTINLTGAIDDDGTGIFLDSNTGGNISISGGVALDTGANTAFTATGGGTVNLTGTNTVGSAGAISGIAVNIANTNIGASGVTFRSLDVNGATVGIVLTNTGSVAGSFFEVRGDGPSDPTDTTLGRTTVGQGGAIVLGSGGTIINVTDAVRLTNANNVRLLNMVLGDATALANDAVTGASVISDNGIESTSVNGLVLDNVKLSRTADHGIQGFGANVGLTLIHSEILNAGDNGAGPTDGDDAMDYKTGINGPAGPHSLIGTVTIARSIVAGMSDTGLEVENFSGDLDLTITDSFFGNNDHSDANCNPCEGDGFLLRADGGSATIDMIVRDTTFNDVANDGIDMGNDQSSNTSTLIAERISGTGNNGADNLIDTANTNGNLRVRITDLTSDSSHRGTVLFFKADGAATTDVTVNTSGGNPNLIQGSAVGNGIEVFIDGDPGTGVLANGNGRVLIQNTDFTNIFNAGVSLLVQDMQTSAGTVDATLDDVSSPKPGRTDNVIVGSVEVVAGGGGNGTLQFNMINSRIGVGADFFGTPTEGLVLRGDRDVDVACVDDLNGGNGTPCTNIGMLTSNDTLIANIMNENGNQVNDGGLRAFVGTDVFTSAALRNNSGNVLIISPAVVTLPTLP